VAGETPHFMVSGIASRVKPRRSPKELRGTAKDTVFQTAG
jgi:hypothetical protein